MKAITYLLALGAVVYMPSIKFIRDLEILSERTCFQTASPWRPELDLRSDVAIVYGVNGSFEERLASWKEHDYKIHLMTGVAWGGYQDYLDGKFDGKEHWHEGQVERDGKMIMHGAKVPYMVPTKPFAEYLTGLVKRAVDAGVSSAHLEEPEFWARGGYSEGFKQEWKDFYNESWEAPHNSPEATWRSSKLKYHLYFRTLQHIFKETKTYSESLGRRVRCYVPTHSLLNYSTWAIVSPETSLANLEGMDGYIGQVWTGTARTPTLYNGVKKERTFENAFLEYASLIGMTHPTGRRVYFLTDPIEDNPNYTWEDYKRNYECTYTAQLLHPDVDYYEVMPWPSRIFTGKYARENNDAKEGIPSWYATEILTLINVLNDMRQENISWNTGSQGIGVLASDTLMFQRFPTHEDDFDQTMADWYGLALPLVKHGIPTKVVLLENLKHPSSTQDVSVILLSYQAMKPPTEEVHNHLAEWVKNGGALLYCGRDDDPYQGIREWWNQDGADYKRPSENLFDLLGLERNPKEGLHQCDKGWLYLLRDNPRDISSDKEKANTLRKIASDLFKRVRPKENWREQNFIELYRGPYRIVSVLDESISESPHHFTGRFIDLFDPNLQILEEVSLDPGSRGLYLDLDKVADKAPFVLATANRLEWASLSETTSYISFSFLAKGPKGTRAATRVLLKDKPKNVRATDPIRKEEYSFEIAWDALNKTALLRYDNHPEGVSIRMELTK